ncbi:hypothetical protein Q1695_007851 [Nippostrongylus brasiliensis]|nr:hypothetical protein Q1695_007851 [Nippostrongylus brasiliensis]
MTMVKKKFTKQLRHAEMGYSEISSSSDLNCNFSTTCRWRNATGSEDSGDWIPSCRYEGDSAHMILPRKETEGTFAYTSGFMGRSTAVLISEVASCQLGGGHIKYWYFKTGIESQLEVCTRQPPGSKEPIALKCYDGLSPSFAQQWIFRVIELPPISQPFELIFRGTFYPPLDVIALTDIEYNSALCDGHNHRRREKRLAPNLIGFHDWQQIRQSERYKGETMIVVAQSSEKKDEFNLTAGNGDVGTFTNQDTQSTTSTPLSTAVTTSFVAEMTTKSSTTPSASSTEPSESSTASIPSTTTDPLANFMLLLRQTAPVLPYIPLLVKSLQSIDGRSPGISDIGFVQPPITPIQPFEALPELRRSPPVAATHIYNTDPTAAIRVNSEPTLVDLAKKFGLLGDDDLLTTLAPSVLDVMTQNPERNAFGIALTTERPDIIPTVYPPKLVKTDPVKKLRISRTELPGSVTKSQEQLEKLHREIFDKKEKETSPSTTSTTQKPLTELVVFKKPTKTESEVATKLTELTRYLPNGASEDLKMLREIPDIEGLTKGMDLSLVSKPGGFAKLKKQFIERLMRRAIGLPVDQPSKAPPSPVAPVRVTQISNNGAEQSAGGSFGGPEEGGGSKLVGFSEGNDVDFSINNPPPAVAFGRELKTALARGSPQKVVSSAAPLPTEQLGSGELASPRIGVAFTPSCPLIDCTFDDNKLCNYLTSSSSEANSVNGSVREWSLSTGPVLNSLTGVPYDLSRRGSFVYAGGTSVSPKETFILSTKLPVELKQPARLDFFVYQAGIKGRLQVCLNTVSNCALNLKGSTIDNKAQRWKNYHVPVSVDTHAIHFVADELQDNYVIGLDHIQLLNKYGMAAESCK